MHFIYITFFFIFSIYKTSRTKFVSFQKLSIRHEIPVFYIQTLCLTQVSFESPPKCKMAKIFNYGRIDSGVIAESKGKSNTCCEAWGYVLSIKINMRFSCSRNYALNRESNKYLMRTLDWRNMIGQLRVLFSYQEIITLLHLD